MEMNLYMMVAPTIAAAFIFIFGFSKISSLVGPSILFFLLSLPAVILPLMDYNVGKSAIFGWSAFYSAFALIGILGIKTARQSRIVSED